ncbi:hypothetical protein HY636_05440 [Candidatus Woesearchaeota archaeon]|nr:hypothetical protein [Candidatus Woesearchaeota archaeon]
MFDEDFGPEDIAEFSEMYMVQSYQMICSRLNHVGIKIRRYKYTELRAS